MSDLSFHIPGSYAKRDMCYNFWLFPYYTDADRQRLLNYITNHLNKIEIFGSLMDELDP